MSNSPGQPRQSNSGPNPRRWRTSTASETQSSCRARLPPAEMATTVIGTIPTRFEATATIGTIGTIGTITTITTGTRGCASGTATGCATTITTGRSSATPTTTPSGSSTSNSTGPG